MRMQNSAKVAEKTYSNQEITKKAWNVKVLSLFLWYLKKNHAIALRQRNGRISPASMLIFSLLQSQFKLLLFFFL